MRSLCKREYTPAPFSRASRAADEEPGPYSHAMQLLTLPINPQDPDLTDICHGRNSLVHEATRNAVPVSGRDIAVHIKSGADGDTEL